MITFDIFSALDITLLQRYIVRPVDEIEALFELLINVVEHTNTNSNSKVLGKDYQMYNGLWYNSFKINNLKASICISLNNHGVPQFIVNPYCFPKTFLSPPSARAYSGRGSLLIATATAVPDCPLAQGTFLPLRYVYEEY